MTKVGEGSYERLSFLEIRRSPLVIQLARHCPMILDRPPIHRFNAIDATCDNPLPLSPLVASIVGNHSHRGPPGSSLHSQIRRNTMTNDARDDRSLPAKQILVLRESR